MSNLVCVCEEIYRSYSDRQFELAKGCGQLLLKLVTL